MNLLKYGIILFFTLSIISCKDTNLEKTESIFQHNEINKVNFDKVLKINEYVYDNNKYGSYLPHHTTMELYTILKVEMIWGI